jgi:Sulfotransferase domain
MNLTMPGTNVLPKKPLPTEAEMAQRVLPTFLIVGAAKAGTTSLYEYLRQHPEVHMAPDKEPHYFVNDYGYPNADVYLRLFEQGKDKKARGEASTGYLYSPESPAWIKQVLGSVRIIIMLRNPAERAFSLYGWMIMDGYEDATTFEEALRREPERQADEGFIRCNPEFFPDYLYFASGLYCEQVKRYYDTFGPDQVKVWLFEDLVKEPQRVCAETFEFINVDASFPPGLAIHNPSYVPWSIPMQFWLRNGARRYFSEGLRKKGLRWNVKWGRRPTKPVAILRELTERYREDVARLQDLIKRDLSAWM